MRVAGYALLGFLSGAIFGLIGAFVFVTLWYEVLGFGAHGGDGYGGLSTFLLLAVVLPLLFGVAGGVWMTRRARNAAPGGPSCGLLVALILLPLLLLCCAILFGVV